MLVAVPIQDMKQPVFPHYGDQSPLFSFDVGAEQWAHLSQIPIVRVMGHCLVMPFELASPSIENDEGVRV